MRRRWILVVLIGLAVVGGLLIATAGDDGGRPALEEVTTGEGLVTEIPEGWVADGRSPWEFAPPGAADGFDQWIVARASGCWPDSCEPRSLDQWVELGPSLPTFVDVRASDGVDVFVVSEESFDDAHVLRALTPTGGDLVFVAAFRDDSLEYVACSARLGPGSDRRLADVIVDVCRDTSL